MLYELKYKGAFEIPDGSGTCVITMTDNNEERALSIVTNREMAMNLKEHEKNLDSVQTNVLDALYRHLILTGTDPVRGIVLDAEKDKGFKAFLHFSEDRTQVKADQAILLSFICGIPVHATKNAFMYFSTPFNKNVQSVALPIIGLPEPMLKKALDQAIGDENYEMASFIRDEIKRREEEHDMLNNEK